MSSPGEYSTRFLEDVRGGMVENRKWRLACTYLVGSQVTPEKFLTELTLRLNRLLDLEEEVKELRKENDRLLRQTL